MYFYAIEDPHKPSVVTLVQMDKCELCKAFVEATDYDEHAHSHAPKVEVPQEPKPPQESKPLQTPKLSRGKTE